MDDVPVHEIYIIILLLFVDGLFTGSKRLVHALVSPF